MASIKDVAQKANVGAATVSRVLNNNGYVSDQTRKKIMQAMEDLDYAPNELARNLFRKETRIIAILVPDIAHPFFAEFVKYAELELYKKGFKTMICSTIKEHNCEIEYLDMLKRYMVDGVITGVHSLQVEEYLKIRKPIVALDRYLGNNIPVVCVDHIQGGRMSAQVMIDHGCKYVVQFQGAKAVNTPAHDRHTAFCELLSEHNIPVFTYEMEWNKFDNSYFENVVDNVFREHPNADGVFGADLLAVNYCKKALMSGIQVPQDLCIVAYDGTYITDICAPLINTVIQPVETLAKESVRLIVKQVNGVSYKDKRIVYQVTLRPSNWSII